MNPMTDMSIKKQVMILLIVLLTPVLLMNGYANHRANGIIQKQVTNAYVELIRQNYAVINRDIDSIQKITTTIVLNHLTQNMRFDPDASIVELARKKEAMDLALANYSLGETMGVPVSYSLFVIYPQEYRDHYTFATDYKRSTTGQGVFFVSDEELEGWLEEAVQRRGRGFLQIIEQLGHNEGKTLAYIRAVNDITNGHNMIGVLVASHVDSVIERSLREVSLPEGSEIFLMDAERQLLAGTHGGIGDEMTIPAPQRFTEAAPNTYYFIDESHMYVLEADRTVGSRLVYQIPIQSLTQQQEELRRTIYMVSIVYFVLCLAVMMYFLRSIIRPLHRMASFFKTYKPGHVMDDEALAIRKDELGVLVNSVNKMSVRLKNLIHDTYEMELKHKEAQLQLLYEQINPHLLYNTLESIYWKCSLEGDREAAEMIKELSKLMKIGLSRGRDLIRMEEEWEHVQAYVGLQQKKYEYRFQTVWDMDEDVHKALIPKVTLQPLVENAIVHGVKYMGEDGLIIVRARKQDDLLVVSIEDNGFKKVDLARIQTYLCDADGDPAVGYGLRNVHRRIQMHFGAEYGVQIAAREPQGTQVIIQLPFDRKGNSDVSSVDRR